MRDTLGTARALSRGMMTTLTVLAALSLVAAAAAQTPRDAAGAPVARGRRSFTGDLRYLMTGTGY